MYSSSNSSNSDSSRLESIKNLFSGWGGGSSSSGEGHLEIGHGGISELATPKINQIQSLLAELGNSSNIQSPQLVVVGTQSSGKSSVLNNIIGWDILPTGKNMVTRTPLQIELITSRGSGENDNIMENGNDSMLYLGEYVNGVWKSKRHFPLKPQPTDEELQYIHSLIETETIRIAGRKKDIGDKPIYLRIHSPNVPELTLVDLPGLTMVACTDQGQPADIKQQISTLIGKYLENSRTIVMAVMPARCDLEADAALELIKQYDSSGDRSVGVLTKVDLMNEGTDISEYLSGKMSRDLAMKYGYFAVRNRTREEMSQISLVQGLQRESEYFQSHPVYNSSGSDRTGISCLRRQISQIYYSHLKKTLPVVLREVENRLSSLEPELERLGREVPTDREGAHNLLYTLVNDFSVKYRQAILDRRDPLHIGRDVKKTMIDFRTILQGTRPFTRDKFPESDLVEAMERCEGNQMSVPIPTIEVLENCLCDPRHRPFYQITETCQALVNDIETMLSNLVASIVNSTLSEYPRLQEWIRDKMDSNVLHQAANSCRDKIKLWIETESHYIWTDNDSFRNLLQGSDEGSNGADSLRKLLQSYYNCYLESGSNHIPKLVMLVLVHWSIRDSTRLLGLLDQFADGNSDKMGLMELLQQPSEIESRREKITSEVTLLRKIRTGLRQG